MDNVPLTFLVMEPINESSGISPISQSQKLGMEVDTWHFENPDSV
jgi:hypothetical protein